MVIRSFIVLAFLAYSGAQAQTTPLQAEANAAWNARDWGRAADAYATIANADTTLVQPRVRLAIALTALGKYAEAVPYIASAERLGAPVPQVAFRMALVEAGRGRMDEAFTQLKRATDAGLGATPIPGDSLAPMQKIKSDSRFAAFTQAMDRNARPCVYDARYNEFDFWLGTWDVRASGAAGSPPARSVITKIESNCVVHESWDSGGPFKGQSYNIYDVTRGKWFQYWVDLTGGVAEYNGVYKDNAMRYEGMVPGPNNTRIPGRMTFFKMGADTVRQLGEGPGPNGTWATTFDLIYTRAKQ